MANVAISALPAWAVPIATDVLPIVDVTAGATKKVSVSALFAGERTIGGVTLPAEGDSVKFLPTADSPWRIYVDTSEVDPNDHVLMQTYNYPISGTRDAAAEPTVRFGFESDYQGNFEWNLDLMEGSGSTFKRPWFYHYTWATGVSYFEMYGTVDISQLTDATSLRVRPFSDVQSSTVFKITNAAGTVDRVWYNLGGFAIQASAADQKALILTAAAAQTASIQEWQDSGNNVLSKIAADGALTMYGSGSNGVNWYASGAANAAYAQMNMYSGNIRLVTWRLTGGTSPNIVFQPNNAVMLTLDGINSLATIADAMNIAVGTTTGTKIGTAGGAAGQKLGFFGATAVVQPLLATGAGATADNIITALQTLGLVRQS